jgi:hypothetical protein
MNWTKKKRQHRLGTNGGQPFRRGEYGVIANKLSTSGRVDENGVVDKNATWLAIIERAKKEEETRLSASRLKPLKKKKETSK